MGKIKVNAMVAQSGGPTSAINATLCGVINGSVGNFSKLYGAKNGIAGLIEDRICDLNYLFNNERELSLLEKTPGATLGSCRMRLPNRLDSFVYERIFHIFDKYDVGCFFYIGGNDSMDTVAKLSEYSRKNCRGVSIIGIPKTIDNDLVLTDHTPGYGSSAKLVATSISELWLDVSSYKLPSVTIVELMGRDTGWLGCACALPYYCFGYGCSLVYLPESNFSLDRFLGDTEKELRYGGPVLLGVCEGVNFGARGDGQDTFGHKDLSGVGKVLETEIKRNLKCKARCVELNLIQRCASHCASLTDITESKKIGFESVKMALSGESGKMSAFVRRDGEYGVDVIGVDAHLVANKIKCVPREFISRDENFVTEKAIEYLSPLIIGESNACYDRGVPCHFKLK